MAAKNRKTLKCAVVQPVRTQSMGREFSQVSSMRNERTPSIFKQSSCGIFPVKVKLTKVSASKSPFCQPGNWDTYKLGELNSGVSLPVDYEIIGTIENPPVVGQSVRVRRTNRNGVITPGDYESTEVVELTDDGFKTLNSVYRMVVLRSVQPFGLRNQEVER